MTNTVMLERAVWAGTVAVALVVVLRVRAIPDVAAASRSSNPNVAAFAVRPSASGDSLAAAAKFTAQHNPFRLERKPATVAYSPELEGVVPVAVRPVRPMLALRGIVGGPPWSAIVDGIPGRDASILLRQGDTIAGIVVRSIRKDTVVLKGTDTTWRLTVKGT
jgi:hypothetical protein